jgi:hypothetical protein
VSDGVPRAEDPDQARPVAEPDTVEPASALATADAVDEVARLLERHLEAWPGEVAKLGSWSGPHRDAFDADAAAFLAEAMHHPAAMRTLATTLRTWAEAP